MSRAVCRYCGEQFGGVTAYDRHLDIRRRTVTTPKGHRVPNEQVVSCRPVDTFGEPMPKSREPRLVATDRNGTRVWVTRIDDRPRDT